MTVVPDPVELTRQLVRIESTSGGAGQGQVFELAAELLRAGGFAVHCDDTEPARYLLATSTADGPRLLFACHVDTVPVDQPELWTCGPTSGEIRDGRLYGRGASDMKSGLAAALAGVVGVGPDAAPCALLLTADEEIGCLGAAAAVPAVAELDIAAVVIPESTRNALFLGHRGTSWLRLSAQGRAAHAGTPQLGTNALLMLAAALLDVSEHGPWWAQRSELGASTVNVATMHAGTAPNIVPESAHAMIDVRPVVPGVAQAIGEWVTARHPGVSIAIELDLAPVSTAADDPWVVSLPADLADAPAVPYFTDAAELTAACPGVPIAIWGPGDPDLAHCRDESVSVPRIVAAAAAYERTLRDWPGYLRSVGGPR